MQDIDYKKFHCKLIPGVDPDTVIGVRTPALRKLAKEVFKSGDYGEFIRNLPHEYYEELNLHGMIICMISDYEEALSEIDKLLPYVDNWAVCDIISPKILKKNREKAIVNILSWIKSDHTYICRFGIGMIMQLYLEDEYFKKSYLDIIAEIKTEEYYINMMRAWLFQVALVKQWKEAIVYIKKELLDKYLSEEIQNNKEEMLEYVKEKYKK